MSGNKDKVRIGIVGTGGMAAAHLKGYGELRQAGYDHFEIAALCDVDDERRTAFAVKVDEMFGRSPLQFSSVEEMASRGGVSAADICTPHSFHHTTAIPCLEAGLDVMVEKPCGITIKATDLIIEAARKNNRIVSVAEQVRRGVKSRCMKWAIDEAEMIGTPRFLSVTGYSVKDFASSKNEYAWQWRMRKLLTGGGMIFDAGAHFADMMYYLFGQVEEVSAWTANFQSLTVDTPELGQAPMDVEDTWIAFLRFKSGLACNWSWSFAAPGEAVAAQILYGSKGSARDRGNWMHTFQNGADITFADGIRKPYEDIEMEFRGQLDTETRNRLFPMRIENDVSLECWDFIDAVRNRRKPEIDAETAKRTKSTCLAVYESAMKRSPVRVEDVYTGRVGAYQDPINEHWKIRR